MPLPDCQRLQTFSVNPWIPSALKKSTSKFGLLEASMQVSIAAGFEGIPSKIMALHFGLLLSEWMRRKPQPAH